MYIKVLLGIIVLILIGKFSPVRRYYFLAKSKRIGSETRMKIYWGVGIIERFKMTIKTLVDFILFWILFEWKDGVFITYLKELWLELWEVLQKIGTIFYHFLEKVSSFFIFITPFGRKAAENSDFRYCLIVCSIWVGIALVLFIGTLWNTIDALENIIISLVMAFIMWYVCFGFCYLIVLIPIYFKILAAIACSIISFIVFVCIGFIIESI